MLNHRIRESIIVTKRKRIRGELPEKDKACIIVAMVLRENAGVFVVQIFCYARLR